MLPSDSFFSLGGFLVGLSSVFFLVADAGFFDFAVLYFFMGVFFLAGVFFFFAPSAAANTAGLEAGVSLADRDGVLRLGVAGGSGEASFCDLAGVASFGSGGATPAAAAGGGVSLILVCFLVS